MDELGEAFEELSNNYDFLKKKFLKIKRKMNSSKIKYLHYLKRKKFYLPQFKTHKRILMLTKFLVRLNFL